MSRVNVLLYRGGMCGDIIGLMLDPTIVKPRAVSVDPYDSEVLPGLVIKPSRERQKSFHRWTLQQKLHDFDRFNSLSRSYWLLSHDTDMVFRSRFPNRFRTLQLICTDDALIHTFAQRFWAMHPIDVIEQVATSIGSNVHNFVDDYAESIRKWQLRYRAADTLDIRNIFNDDFVKDLGKIAVFNRKRAKRLHQEWLAIQKGSVNTVI